MVVGVTACGWMVAGGAFMAGTLLPEDSLPATRPLSSSHEP